MDTKNEAILSVEEERGLLAPIDQYVGGIQEKINALRVEGTDKVVSLTNHMAIVKENANYNKAEKSAIIAEDRKALEKAKAVEEARRSEPRRDQITDRRGGQLSGRKLRQGILRQGRRFLCGGKGGRGQTL